MHIIIVLVFVLSIVIFSKIYVVLLTCICLMVVQVLLLTVTPHSCRKYQNSTPYKIKTPELIDIKFGTVDYICQICPQTKFGDSLISGSFWGNTWNIRTLWLFPRRMVILFSSTVEQSSIARHCCPPFLSIFCCRLKSHLFSLSYPAFWLFYHLYLARAVTRHFGHYNRYYI